MSLDSFFAPASIAVIGASPDRTKIRGRLFHLLRANGYPGIIYPINPSYQEIEGLKCHPTLASVGAPIDLAIVAIPAPSVLETLARSAEAGVRNAVVISSGFAEESEVQAAAQAEIAAIAQRSGMRILGPNTEGFHNETGKVAANFSPTVELKPGEERLVATTQRVGIVAQSGGMGFALFNRGLALGLTFSYVVSTGNEVDLTVADFLDYMVDDAATSAILLFLESVRAPAQFAAAAARAAAKGKPIVAIKIGRSGAGERAAQSHTASIAGWDAAYEAVFRTHNVTIARDPDEAVAILATLTTSPPARGNRVGIVTVSGGAGAWQADMLSAVGLEVPELRPKTQAVMRDFMPSYGSPRNPVDITAQGVTTGGSIRAIEALCDGDEVDIVVVAASLSSEQRVSVDPAALKPILAAQKKPVLISSYTQPSLLARRAMAGAGAVIHTAIEPMAKAARAIVERGRFLAGEARPASQPLALAAGPQAETLAEFEAKALLAGCGLPMPPQRLVTAAQELEGAAADLGFPLAVKIQSRDILHKTEIGGVKLGVADLAALRRAFADVRKAAHARTPAAKIAGVLIEAMAGKGVEIIVGAIRDPGFGPVLMVGAGGIATEVFKDVTYRLAPVDERQALAMLSELRSAPLLHGFRGAPRADVTALAKLVAHVSAIAAVNREAIREIELNPVIVHTDGHGCSIADALIVLEAQGA
jgi:acetate---CoA ligase (ADP-forming)